ncbi:DUF7933 domain-containing protein [Micromonospora antibiotica]|uniref:DUF3494 domain-containing protein n=1 Tax=Micromonospora antibiotica TaxID=2807623 RepID=A0ABS3V2U5_9ACTN|nr:ice-binding family protein [Micromonospora antibiotica]MBO4159929.1 DUF3494 domain-containing protein [Micromonospora antibiotica]
MIGGEISVSVIRLARACRVRRRRTALVMAGAVAATTMMVGLVDSPAWAQTTVPLGTAETYGVLAGQAVTDVPPPVGPSTINGDLGVWPGTSVTGAPVVNGAIHVGDTQAMQAQSDLTTAYNFAAAEPTTSIVSADLGGQTLVPGVYTSPATMSLTGTVTLDGQNDPDSVFIFQAGSSLITAVDSRVSLINGAQPCNVFWQVSSSATLNTRTVFVGTILALQSATLGEGATVAGRVLARNGAVTLIHNTITRPFCATAVAPPTIAKAFDDAIIPAGGTTALSFTLTNPNTNTTLTGVTFTDALPAGLVVATPNGLTGSCGGGTIAATAGGGSISLTGATLPAGGSCTFSVNVTGTTSGTKVNTSGPVDSTESGPGAPASATVVVGAAAVAPPTIAKAFDDAIIPAGGTTALSFTLTNPNVGTALTGVTFTDALPAGLVVATPNGLTGSCGGGTIAATAGGGSISLTGATLPAGGSCTFSVNVTATTSGTKVNTSGPVNSNESGPGTPAAASITVRVAAAPTFTKAFEDPTIPLDGTTTVSFTLTNPNTNTTLTGVSFVDNLPAGLVVATPNGAQTTCASGTIVATAGSSSISLFGATMPAGSTCTVSVNVTGTTTGTKVNTTLPVTSVQSGPGAPASASVAVGPAVIAAPTISKAFGDATIPAGGTTALSFTLTNPNTNTTLTGVTFTDALPAGLVVATPNGLTGSCGGGTIAATAGGGSISLTGATLPAGGSCTFSVNVTATTSGTKVNTSGPVNSNESGPGAPASANLIVGAFAAPTITKAFRDATIALHGTTTLSFTLGNPNGNVPLTGVGFVDNLPAGLVVATPAAAQSTCASGTVTAAPGGSSISLAGATLSPGGTCTVSVNVTGKTTGKKVNTTAATSVESGPGAPASASLTVRKGILPVTGSDSASYATVALAMIGLGAVLIGMSYRAARRRRHAA